MSLPETPSFSSHPYSHALQLKLYQAFIFSIPILFSIILFLLFYLFYLKRRAYVLSTSPPPLPRSFNYGTPFVPMLQPCEMGLMKGYLKDKLQKVLFDEDLQARDSVCCVCLGEYEMKEELVQVPSCKHVFHVDCLHHWLQSNSTCPLCRSSVFVDVGPISSSSSSSPPPPPPGGPLPIQPNLQQQGQLSVGGSSTVLTTQGTTFEAASTSGSNHASGNHSAQGTTTSSELPHGGPLTIQSNAQQQAQLSVDGSSSTVLATQGTTSSAESTSASDDSSSGCLRVSSSSHETSRSISSGLSVVVHVQAK